ncbi:hypothetical protein [Achromobacter sp. DH1f]|uniref:hypothetical protein n=1 Tax=Achromobacter sp. DH1f TaxID=1397275 RepID=UPI000469E46C|nr:hypothetical protein [Achromobacter sp. DH1f]
MKLSNRDLAQLGANHPLVARLRAQGHIGPGAPGSGAATPSKPRPPGAPSQAEEKFAIDLRALRIAAPEREYRLHPTRAFRFDFAWPELPCGRRLAVEIEGGIHSRGRHVRPQGYKRDLEKYNSAISMGWTLLRFSPDMVFSGAAVQSVQSWMSAGAPVA